MGAAQKLDIVGAKGGSDKPKQPTEAPDSLRSVAVAKMLIAVGEGEFEGTPTARDIYLDSTPLADQAGNLNFPNVKWEWRTGSVEQSYIQGIPSVANELPENVELRSENPYIRAIDKLDLDAIRLRFAWPMLQSIDDGGNVNGYRIEYAVDLATDGGPYQQVLLEAVDGKTTSTYERTRRIDLPRATSGWLLRVRRLTPNQNNNKIADTMQIVGRTEVIDVKIRYPNTALLYIEFSAEQFRNIPAVTVDCDARKFQVPSNYDPRTRVYTGVWDGTFKEAWTDNPAWHTYGVTVNDRFGLGRRIKSWQVDKWELYRIAQYCDQLVPNGKGGQEPRFICNLNLQSQADAWSLLRDISAIYRGMTYWAQGQVYSLADMPRDTDFDFAYTRANVIDGKFTYSSASERTRYSRALISYDNPANSYDTDVTSVTDQKLQRRYGDNVLEISAIGCTRESEAQRRGKWALLTNSRDRGITFKVGLDGRIPLPGYVIPVADELLAGRPIGGRIAAVSGRTIGLDRDTQAKAGDRLILNLPDGTCQARSVQSVSGRAVTVTTAYSVAPEPELVWALDADDLAVPLYRVTSVTRPEPGVFEISAVQYDPSKFAHIDTGARLEERPISVIPVTVVPPPASVTLTSSSAVNQGIAVSTMTIAWPAVAGAVAYDVEWRKDNGNWIKLQRTGSTSVDVTGIYAGAYLARVRAVSAFDISSIWKSSNLTQLTGKVGLPPAVSFLTTAALVYGIGLSWGFPAGAEDTERTEIWYSKTNSRNDAIKLGDFAYPQAKHELHGLAAGVSFFFWARLIDRTGNVGAWYPAGMGVNGQSSADQSEYEEYFKDKITEGALYPALQERIDLIDGPPSLPGSVSQRVEEVKVQVAEVQVDLQQQIDQVSTVAKSAEYQKEKAYAAGASTRLNDRLYQAKIAVPADLTGAKAPPNTTYWLDVGQVVSQSNGLAGRVTTVETKVTEQDGELTAQAQRIDGVQSSLDGKADASTVGTLANRVTQNEQGLTSQGSAITGLNNSLTTTNQNVTTAQQAADAANTLAGGKGKVIIQSGAPAAGDRLPQNLWIDTASNANTPKRWTGSAWAAVTDKAATDAAAAAASALAQVATKAEASTVQALSNEVAQQGQTIAAHGQAITHINVSVANSDSENWIRNPLFNVGGDVSSNAFTTYVAGTDPSVPQPCPSTRVGVMTKAASGLLTIALPIKNGSYRVPVLVGETLALSIRMAVIGGATNSSRMVVTFYDQGGANLGNHRVVTYSQAVTGWQQPAGSIVVPSGAVSAGVSIFNETAGPVGSVIFFAEPVLNRMDGASGVVAAATQSLDARVATAEDGITSQGSALTQLTNTVAGKADNSALQSLGSTVAQQGNTLNAQGTAVTQLQSTVGGIGGSGSNLLPAEYCAFGEIVPAFYKAGGITVSTEAEAGAYSGSMLKVVSPASGQNHIYMASALADYNLRVEPGAKYIVSFTVKSDVAKVIRVRVRAPNSAGVAIETTLSDVSVAAGIGRYSFVATMPATVVDRGLLLFFIPQPVAAGTTWLDALMIERQVGTAATPSDFSPGPSARAIAGQATAISRLDTTVNQQGTAITAQASRLDGLYVQVNPEMEGDSSGLAGAQGGLVGVWTEQSARIEDGIATGKKIETVQAQIGEASATVQQISETVVDVNGRVSAMTTIKAETVAGGQKVMAGLALGSDGETSEILAFAQRFAIVDETSGSMMLPFVVQGGQVFINQAIINRAFIQEIVAGMTIRSAALNSQGLPLLEINFAAGTFVLRGQDADGSTLLNNGGLYVYDAAGIERTAVGRMT